MQDAALSVSGDIGAIAIKGGVLGSAIRSDGKIGAVTVGRDWIASNLIAGVTAGPDSLFGTDDDVLISGGNQIIAKIASIVIKGTVSGNEGGTDHFGFVAEQIAAFSSGGARIALTPGPSNDLAGVLVGASGDVKVREIA